MMTLVLDKGKTLFWDEVPLTWVDPAWTSGTVYRLFVNGVANAVYTGTGFAHTDTRKFPGTTYTYTLKAYRPGTPEVLIGEVSTAVTTPIRDWMGAKVTTTTASSVTITWVDPDQRSVQSWQVLRNGVIVKSGITVKTFTDTGLAANTTYNYTLRAVRDGIVIPRDSTFTGKTLVAATPPAPTKVTGTMVSNGTPGTWYSWAGATTTTKTSKFRLPAGTQQAYINKIELFVSGYGGTGYINPKVHTTSLGNRTLPGTTAGKPGWTVHTVNNIPVPRGVDVAIGFTHSSGGAGYRSQWGWPSGQVLGYRVHWWYYK
jgi:hypothetical protein